MKTSTVFPRCPVSIPEFKDRIFINENLTGHRHFVMGQADKMQEGGGGGEVLLSFLAAGP